jgi:hypothetical protein
MSPKCHSGVFDKELFDIITLINVEKVYWQREHVPRWHPAW